MYRLPEIDCKGHSDEPQRCELGGNHRIDGRWRLARIIVADDDDDVRRSLSRLLRALGHDVLEAENGRGVVEAVRSGTVDLVITDINMPGMDGLEVVEAVRAVGSEVPVIAVSGGPFAKQVLLPHAGALGAFATLKKPFDIAELGRIVERALMGAGSRSGSGA